MQRLWRTLYNLPALRVDGSQWDKLFADGERLRIGALDGEVMFSPGHALASITYVIGDAAFVNDTLSMPDSGTARADFPGGDARTRWHSSARILALPDATRLFTGHGYQPGGRPPAWEGTVGAQKAGNPHVRAGEEAFIRLRQDRDRTLGMPKLILLSLQLNIAGGRLPAPEANGRRYLKILLNAPGRLARSALGHRLIMAQPDADRGQLDQR